MSDAAQPALTDPALRALDYYRLVDAGDLSGVSALFDEHIIYRRPGCPVIEGKQAVDDFFRTARGIARSAHTVDIVAFDEDCVVVEGRLEGELEDGRLLDVRFADVFWFSGSLVRRRHTYIDAPLA